MIPSLLQDFLVKEFKKIFLGFKLKNVKNEDSELNIYPQYLPAKKSQKDSDHFPFVTVKIMEGEDPNEIDANTCRIMLMVGIYDINEDYQGYKDVLNILQKMYEHLMVNKLFDDRYEIEYPIKFTLTDEDYQPYFFGALDTSWIIGKVTMKPDNLI
ncbi:MAG: hypothetical protein ACI8WT_001751 [Clostridium sp.]|jgi:hypothetical protein